jgi:flagellar biogenesis protein FliO
MNGFSRFRTAAAVIAVAAIAGALSSPAAAEDGPFAAGEASSPPRRITPPNRPLRTASKSGEPRKPTTGSFWQTLLVLGGIVAVILLGAKYLRKHGPRLPGGIPNDALEVLGKRAIDRGQLIYLVRLGSRILIIGSSSGGLQTLGEVTDPVEIDFLSGLCKQPAQSSKVAQGFFALFNRQFADSPPQESDAAPSGVHAAASPHDGYAAAPSIADREEAHV